MNEIAAFAMSKVGCGYIYGAKGQTCTERFRQQQATQYPAQAANILGIGAKWDGKEVWECAQLTKYAARAAGLDLPSGATSQWNKTAWARKGTMDTLPAGEVCFLYRREAGSSTVMAHTGISLGDGTCIHARGTAYGVVRQSMSQYAWTHWASLWDASSGKEENEVDTMSGTHGTKMMVATADGNPLKLRPDPSTKNGYLAKLPVGTEVEVIARHDVGGEVWNFVKLATGKIGYVMEKYLAGVSGEAEQVPEAEKPIAGKMVVLKLPVEAVRVLQDALAGVE